MGNTARKYHRRKVLKQANHPVRDDCLFWADAAGRPAAPPAAHAPSCLFMGGKSIDECMPCQLANVYAPMVWETGEPQLIHLDNLRADLLITDDPSAVGVTTYNGEPGAPEIFGRLRRGDESSLFILGPMIVEQCPHGDHAASPEESAEIQKQYFPGVELLSQPPSKEERERMAKKLGGKVRIGDLKGQWVDADGKPDLGPEHDLDCRYLGGSGACFTCHIVDMAEAILASGNPESIRNGREGYCIQTAPSSQTRLFDAVKAGEFPAPIFRLRREDGQEIYYWLLGEDHEREHHAEEQTFHRF
jgi:hypothetical protein